MGESRRQRKLPVRFGGGWVETDARKRARRHPSTLRHPPARSRGQLARDPGLARAPLADHQRPLHPSHPEGRTTGRRSAGATYGWHAMLTLGDIFRRYGPQYRARFGHQKSSEQHAAMRAIEQCRTEALGGHVYSCPACATTRYSYHSCRNRHCPTCQQDASQTWLAQQQDLLLPVPYFLVTFTLPSGLRTLARQQQRTIYSLLFRASAAALQQLAQDPRFLGGQIGMLGVLQTWTRDLRFHPHVHYLVPALALAPDGKKWIVGRRSFLVHSKPLALLFRAKFRAALRQTALYREVSAESWTQSWVVDCRAVGVEWPR
jgi:hypothetical protein